MIYYRRGNNLEGQDMSRTRFISRLGAVLLAAALLAPGLGVIPAQAAVETRIYTVEDLWGIGNDPGGTYTLMNDLDLSGWNGGWRCPSSSAAPFTAAGTRFRACGCGMSSPPACSA